MKKKVLKIFLIKFDINLLYFLCVHVLLLLLIAYKMSDNMYTTVVHHYFHFILILNFFPFI